MRLTVALPHRIALDESATKVSAEGLHGAFTLLPRHRDFVVILEPGILTYSDADAAEHYLAVDGGVLVKAGREVRVSTHAAVKGDRLEELERVVQEAFQQIDHSEQQARGAQARLATRVLHEMLQFEDPG